MRPTHARARRTARRRLPAPLSAGGWQKRARLRFNSARRVSLQNGNAATRKNVERRWPTTPPGQIKTQTYGFFRAGRALSRPHRRANNPSAAPNTPRPRPRTASRSARTGSIDRSRAQAPHSLKSAGSDAQGAQARCALEYMGACGTRRIRFGNLRRAAQCHGRKSGQGAVCWST